ncbi:hypothetical protein QMZ05_27390, partial [Bradyrhizobium sp. INPA03-11B]|uniref:hypothetical protein n=1 Tax=Bradyrhizobium sp. INPA03-11B TaxID=418598 RepID=UPI00338D8D66
MRNARINACIRILQQNDKALKNAWRGHCGADELDEELAGTAADPRQNDLLAVFSTKPSIVVNDDSCTNPAAPVATTSACGLGSSSLYPNLQAGAEMRIRLPGNKCGTFIPLLLTNKTDFACNAIQTRIACVDASYDANTDRTKLKLSTRRTGNSESTTIEFGAPELAQHDGRLSDLVNHPQFTIIPASINGASVTKTLLEIVRSLEKDCNGSRRHSAAECARLARFQADAKMQEVTRRYRNPRHDSSKDAIVQDGERIVAFLREKHIDAIEEQWILFLSIAANEVGLQVKDGTVTTYDPIYAVSDAIYGNSGLSFGAHQIDLGANDDSEVKLFWDVIDAYKSQHPDANLDQAAMAKNCVDLPMRLMTVGALAMTYRTAPNMTIALRSGEGFEEYNERLLSYLAEETKATRGLSGLFRKSMILRVLFSDLKNQVGSGSRVRVLANDAVSGGIDIDS